MFYDIGEFLNGRNDIRTNHRFRFVIHSAFCHTVLNGGEDSTVEVEFTEDDVRAGLVTIIIETIIEEV